MAQNWSKLFSRINWRNRPNSTTALNEVNLNKSDYALDKIDDRVIMLDTYKVDMSVVNEMVADIEVDGSTGVITVTYKNGSTKTFDTNLEKIAVNFDFDKNTQQIILLMPDGSKQYIDLSAFITQYEFLDTNTITFSVDSSGKISATIKNGAITEDMLESGYLAEIKVEVGKVKTYSENAYLSEQNAETDAINAQSYAVGRTGTRENEDTDNAKYYKEQAKDSSDSASNSASSALASSQTATTKASEAAASATNASKSESNANTYATNASDSATSASSSATTATQKASEASTSATNASNSANTATTKANEAKSSANAAALSESNALASKTAAAQSESNAKTSESNASNSAKSASASASSASSSATTATNKATEAANSASDASDSANTATTKALEAATSSANAAQSETNSKNNANLSESYAVGTDGVVRPNDNIDCAKYYYEQSRLISESFSGALRPMGTVAFSNLPELSSVTVGDMYNISDEFVTTSDFMEGAGITLPAGSNIFKTVDGKWDALAGSPVTGVKGEKETTFRRGNVNITADNIGALKTDGNASNTTATFSQASSRENIVSGEKLSVIFGKIMKFFADLKTVAFSGSYNDLSNKPSTATTSANGFMSKTDKAKLDGIETGAQVNTITGVKGNAESSYRTGKVNLTPANLGALATNGDSKSNTVTFTSNDVSDGNATSWTSVKALTGGITHATFFQRVSQMFKNVRYLYKMLGTTDISSIGDGTVTGGLNTLNSNLQDKVDKTYFESTGDTTYIKASQSARVTNLDSTSYIPLTASDFVTPSGNLNAVINAFGNISSFQFVTMSAQRDSNFTNLIQFYVTNVGGKKVFVTPTSGTSFPSAISHINISQNVVQIVFFNELTAGIDYSVDMLIIG